MADKRFEYPVMDSIVECLYDAGSDLEYAGVNLEHVEASDMFRYAAAACDLRDADCCRSEHIAEAELAKWHDIITEYASD